MSELLDQLVDEYIKLDEELGRLIKRKVTKRHKEIYSRQIELMQNILDVSGRWPMDIIREETRARFVL